ncbi:PhzF family phenazine biosynthesis protein [Emticicia sp. SJ17W-69]|uniref:PhzF family phenazine biosynthesis protein n=1 Tax=Emticicia sp. SJ17W-69 TaxID=3421657 RepID=UPI003EBD4EB0
MKPIKYYILDVFANNKYQGNQLAVFVDFDNQISDSEMQQIAREINFAETTFIKANEGNERFVVRIFTPEHEVPFAGHPSIGTSYIIAKFILPEIKQKLTLALAHCDIEMTIEQPDSIDESVFNMRQAQPEFREIFTHEEVADELGISLGNLDISLPIQEISTGLPYILIPLNSLKAIENLKFQYSTIQYFLEKRFKYKTNSSTGHSTSFFFFTKETYEATSNYNTRMLLLENNRLSEDAATGSANGCFLAYLLKYINPKITATIEQGFQINRKSYIYLDGVRENETYQINVGGRSKLISEGTWYI